VHHVGNELAHVLDFAVTIGRALERREARCDVAQLFCFVADALEVRDGLDDGDDQA
jgi:hypothetical protein